MQRLTALSLCRVQVSRLSGVLLPDDPEYSAIVREARARFAKPGGEKLFQKREAKLTRLAGDLQSKEFLVSTLLREISTLRLQCVLYAGQVDLDKQQMGSIVQDKEQRVDRWEEQERERQRLKAERIAREQQRMQQQQQQRQQAIPLTHFNRFLPPQLQQHAPAPFAPAPFAAAQDAAMDSDGSA